MYQQKHVFSSIKKMFPKKSSYVDCTFQAIPSVRIIERYLLAVPVVQDSQHHGNNGDNNEDNDQENSDDDPRCIATATTATTAASLVLRASSSSGRVSWTQREVINP